MILRKTWLMAYNSWAQSWQQNSKGLFMISQQLRVAAMIPRCSIDYNFSYITIPFLPLKTGKSLWHSLRCLSICQQIQSSKTVCFAIQRYQQGQSMLSKTYLCLTLSLLISLSLSFVLAPDLTNSIYTTFVVHYPQAKVPGAKMYLRGDNCNLTWAQGRLMDHSGNNQWTTALLCPENITISLKAKLNDSEWMFGSNRVFTGGQRTVDIYPCFFPQANPVEDKPAVHSAILKNSRKVSIFYPPSYNDNTLTQYEVLIMHDGQNLFDNSKAAFGSAWNIQDTINQMTFAGKMRVIIVVGLWNTNDRNNEYTYSYDPDYKFGGKGDLYLDFIQKEILPLFPQWFKGRAKSGPYGIAGSSLGGLISCYAAYTRPAIFNKAICMSSSFWWNRQDFNSRVLKDQKHHQGVTFYVDSGDSGSGQDSMNQTITVYKRLQGIGYTPKELFYYLDKGGQHNEYYWGKRFNIPMNRLYP